jgi:hypothetical protein
VRQGRDIFSVSRGAGKYGGTEMEKDLLQVRVRRACNKAFEGAIRLLRVQ